MVKYFLISSDFPINLDFSLKMDWRKMSLENHSHMSKIAEFSGDVHFFSFRPEISFLDKFRPKNQNCQFKLKFGM